MIIHKRNYSFVGTYRITRKPEAQLNKMKYVICVMSETEHKINLFSLTIHKSKGKLDAKVQIVRLFIANSRSSGGATWIQNDTNREIFGYILRYTHKYA